MPTVSPNASPPALRCYMMYKQADVLKSAITKSDCRLFTRFRNGYEQ